MFNSFSSKSNFLKFKLHLFLFKLLISLGLFSACSTSTKTTNNTNNNNVVSSNTKEDKFIGKSEDTVEYFQENYARNEDFIYKKSIHTVMAYRKGWELSNPVLLLGSNEVLHFSFDELDKDLVNYNYTIVHCNSDWETSSLDESEYLDGFFQDFITDYKYSFNTLQQYIHYSVDVPNKNIKIKMSGNYIFKVFENNNPDNVVLTKRFIVIETNVKIAEKVKRATNLDDRQEKQEVDFEINLNNFSVSNLHNDLKVVLMKNNRWDNAITDLKPLFIRDQLLIYDYNSENVFNGGNEYRNLNIQSLRYKDPKIAAILKFENIHKVYVKNEEKRTYKKYLNYPDINGKFTIKVQEGVDYDIEADYAYVNFSLLFDEPIGNGNLYVFGQLSDWKFRDDLKMTYNNREGKYEATAFLKQGYYNYQYVLVKDKSNKGDVSFIEGNHYETENNYTILVYYRDPLRNFDRIIGYHSFVSNL